MPAGDQVVIDLLNELKLDVAQLTKNILELQENNAQSAVEGLEMYKTLNAKFDMFKNLEAQSRESIQQQNASTARKLTRPAYFKKLFTEDREKYLDVLYTQAEIDDAYKSKEVVAKKKEADRISKVVTILYTTHIKANNPEGRFGAFASLYDTATASK
jgi:hypothetical protein